MRAVPRGEGTDAVTAASTTRHDAPLVLIVGEEQTIRLSLDAILGAEGFRTLHGRDGQDGLRIVRADHVDVVILDLMMPLKDGWRFLRDLRDMRGPVPPVVVISARGDGERATVLRLAAAVQVSTPFDMGRLVELVQRTRRHRVGVRSA
jgi:DNA-binding response OmpR family regulator